MKNKIIYSFLFLICLSSTLFSQIKGIVKDDKGLAVSNANVIVLDSVKEVEAFAITNKLGEFEITDFKLGNKTIQIKKPIFSPYEEEILIDKQGFDLGIFTLQKEDAIGLKEVIVKATDNFYKKDTTVFDAAKYRTGKEMNVEDLIKNIPGASVDKDGRIKIGKKDVQAVLVEGDDLFDKGYSILTQAMTDQSVAKIQLINNHTKNKLTKDIYKSDALAINLILDDKAKDQWSGSALISSTSYIENKQQVRLNLMNFSKRRKLFALFNYNTIGFDEMKGVDYLIGNKSTSAYSFDKAENVTSLPNLANLYQSNYQFEDNRTNFNNDKIGVLNYVTNFKKSKLQILGIYNRIQKNNYIDEVESYNDNEIEFVNKQNLHWNKKVSNYFAKVEWNKEISANSNFSFVNRSYFLDEDNANNFLFNDSSIKLNGYNHTNSVESQGIYTNKLDSSRLVTIVANHLYQNRPYQFTETNPIFSEIYNNPTLVHLNQNIHNNQQLFGVKGSFFKKLSEKESYYISVGTNYQNIKLNSIFSGYNQDFSSEYKLDNSSNKLNFEQFKTYLDPTYEKEWKSFKLKASFPLEYYTTTIRNEGVIDNHQFKVAPQVNFTYEKRKFGQLSFNYNYSVVPTSFDAYYQELIYKGNRQFTKNNILNYELFGGSIFSLNYRKSSGINSGIELGFMYQIQNKSIGYNSLFTKNYTTNEQVVVDGMEMISPSFTYKYFLLPIKSKIQFRTTYSLIKSSVIVNDKLIRNSFSGYNFELETKSGFTGIWNYELGASLMYNLSKNKLNSYHYNNFNAYSNVYFILTKQTTLDINYEYYNFGGQNQASTNFLDVKINHQFQKSKIKFFIKGNNLLNNKSIKRTIISPVNERYFTQRLLPLHILLGMNIVL